MFPFPCACHSSLTHSITFDFYFFLVLFYLIHFLSIHYPYKYFFILISIHSFISHILHANVFLLPFSSSYTPCSFFLPSLISNIRVALCTQTEHKHTHKIILCGISFKIKGKSANFLSYVGQISLPADYGKLCIEM